MLFYTCETPNKHNEVTLKSKTQSKNHLDSRLNVIQLERAAVFPLQPTLIMNIMNLQNVDKMKGKARRDWEITWMCPGWSQLLLDER